MIEHMRGGPQQYIARILGSSAGRDPLALLSSTSDRCLNHHGMHAERGVESVEHLLRLSAGHDLNHLSQIEGMPAGQVEP